MATVARRIAPAEEKAATAADYAELMDDFMGQLWASGVLTLWAKSGTFAGDLHEGIPNYLSIIGERQDSLRHARSTILDEAGAGVGKIYTDCAGITGGDVAATQRRLDHVVGGHWHSGSAALQLRTADAVRPFE